MEDDVPFLGTIDKLGTAFMDKQIATGMSMVRQWFPPHDNLSLYCCSGYGSYLAIPIMRKAVEDAEASGGLTQDQAVQLLKKCLEVLYYRDAHSGTKYTIGIITSAGVTIDGPFNIESNWEVAAMVKGYE